MRQQHGQPARELLGGSRGLEQLHLSVFCFDCGWNVCGCVLVSLRVCEYAFGPSVSSVLRVKVSLFCCVCVCVNAWLVLLCLSGCEECVFMCVTLQQAKARKSRR